MIGELRHRDPLLFWSGALMLLMLLLVTLISISDTRQILGLNPWIKPMKFMTSITIFLWTVAWFMPDTEPRPIARSVVRWTIATAMTVESAPGAEASSASSLRQPETRTSQKEDA